MLQVILGASPNERRYSNKATELLVNSGYDVYPVGVKLGSISGIEIHKEFPVDKDIDTISMYLSVDNQKNYYNMIFNNLPRRIIFNPGTYNPEFQKELSQKGVDVINDCVLMMNSRGAY